MAVVALMIVGVALVLARDLGTKIDQGSARGRHAIAVAHGTAQHPRAIFARVRSHPQQRIHGDFDMICKVGSSQAERTGRFSGRTTVVKKLGHPFTRPDSCSVGISARLKHHGRIIVQHWARG